VNYCERNRIAFIPWFPLAAGRIAGERLNQVARAHRADPHKIAIAWLLKRSRFMLPIPGTSTVKHLEENVAASSLQLSAGEFEELSQMAQFAGPIGNHAE